MNKLGMKSVRLVAALLGLGILYSLVMYVFVGFTPYIHPLIEFSSHFDASLYVEVDMCILLIICALLVVSQALWVRLALLIVAPWYLIAACMLLLKAFLNMGPLDLEFALPGLAGALFVILIILTLVELATRWKSPKVRMVLGRASTPWRIVNGILCAGAGLCLYGYLSAGSIGEGYYSALADGTWFPAALLILAGAGILLNRWWSLITVVVLLLILLLCYQLYVVIDIAFGNSVTDKEGLELLLIMIGYLLPSMYMIGTAFMALWYARSVRNSNG